MNLLKFKFIRKYKKAERFLKGHPFWPSFLSNGGVLLLFLILSIGFTILCGINSTRNILPELRVIELTTKGDEYTWLRKLTLLHDIDKSYQDTLTLEYSFARGDMRPVNEQYDESRFDSWMNRRGPFRYEKDSVMISELELSTLVPHELHYCAHDIDDLSQSQYPEYHFGVIESNNGLCFRKYNFCKNGWENKAKFKDVITGNFIGPGNKNPYIYLHFKLNAGAVFDNNHGKIIFQFSPKDPLYDETYSPFNLINVFPEPTYASPSFIIYEEDGLKKVLANGGFTFLGEDMGIKKRTDRSNFLWTVLFGTAIALTIDILVHLILRWKDILPSRRKKS
jgi:hypothetical protein